MHTAAKHDAQASGHAHDPDLVARLEHDLPTRLAVGRGNAVFVYGSCFHRRRRITDLRLLVDGVSCPLMAHAMPRRDLFLALHPGGVEADASPRLDWEAAGEDPHGHAYRSGFWGFVTFVPPDRPRAVRIELAATLDDGGEATAALASLELEPGTGREPVALRNGGAGDEPLVAICMATYDPPLELFESQLDSIRAQTHRNWVCVISDDRSHPARYAAMEELVGDDPRFSMSRSAQRLGFYANFERALKMAPEEARYVTLADQDDRWHPDKLETLVGNLGRAELVYSDARIVNAQGEVLSETYWSKRRTNHGNLASLLIANTITGAAALFRRELLDYVLPFPPRLGIHFHDHWIALVGLACGRVRYVDRPLYDYVQHHGAVLGHAAANRVTRAQQALAGRSRLLARLHPLGARIFRLLRGDWRGSALDLRSKYFLRVCRMLHFARILELRCGERMSFAKRRALRRFESIDDSPLSAAWLAVRTTRRWVGWNETLGSEWPLLEGVAWRRMLTLLNVGRDLPGRWTYDARFPAYSPDLSATDAEQEPSVRLLREALAPLDLDVRPEAPERVNVLIPAADLRDPEDGSIARLSLAHKLAGLGLRVRVATVGDRGPLPRDWRRRIESHPGLEAALSRVEVAVAHGAPYELSRRDAFVGTGWSTAYLAQGALAAIERQRFLYLIQDYEPFAYPMGADAALARESYLLPHFAVVSTELLRDYLRRQRIGVYAPGAAAGDRASVAFEPAIAAATPLPPDELVSRPTRRLLLHAPFGEHAAHHMSELGALAVAECVRDGLFDSAWELYALGSRGGARRIALDSGAALEVVPRSRGAAYAELLARHDVGLALMLTPQPGLVPLEMAAAGLLVVTNSFENKTRVALERISANLLTAEPTLGALMAKLREAVTSVGDVERRTRGAAVNWSRDWDSSFDVPVIDRVGSLLAAS